MSEVPQIAAFYGETLSFLRPLQFGPRELRFLQLTTFTIRIRYLPGLPNAIRPLDNYFRHNDVLFARNWGFIFVHLFYYFLHDDVDLEFWTSLLL